MTGVKGHRASDTIYFTYIILLFSAPQSLRIYVSGIYTRYNSHCYPVRSIIHPFSLLHLKSSRRYAARRASTPSAL